MLPACFFALIFRSRHYFFGEDVNEVFFDARSS